MNIEELATNYGNAVVRLKFANIDRKALRSTSTTEEIVKATSECLNARKDVNKTKKALLNYACKDVKDKLGWLDKVDPNQIPLDLPAAKHDEHFREQVEVAIAEADSPDAVWHDAPFTTVDDDDDEELDSEARK